jgi:hypothetical protein
MNEVVIYEVSATARCWRLYDCVECGCAYRYLCVSEVTGAGGTPEMAAENANLAAAKALEEDVQSQPCPQCGLVQPYMTAHKKYKRHTLYTVLALAAAGAGAGILLAGKTGVERGELLLAGGAIFAFLFHLLQSLSNPNWSRRRNLRFAQSELAARRTEVVREGEMNDDDPRTKIFGLGHVFYLVLAAGAVIAAGVPGTMAKMKGWHWNQDVTPGMVAPGDTVRVNFTETVDSAGGMWLGHPKVTWENAAEFGGGPAPFTVRAKSDDWEEATGKNLKNETVNLGVDLVLNADEELVGKTLQVKIDMNVLYPRAGVADTITPEMTKASRTVSFKVGPPGALAESQQVRTVGSWTALGLIFLSGVGLAGLSWKLRARCSPGLMQPWGDVGRVEVKGFGASRATMFNGGESDENDDRDDRDNRGSGRGTSRAEPGSETTEEKKPATSGATKPWHRW